MIVCSDASALKVASQIEKWKEQLGIEDSDKHRVEDKA